MPKPLRAAYLACLLVLLLRLLGPGGLEPRAASAAQTAARDATLAEAELARRNGDYDGAAAILRLLVVEADPETASEALLQLGVALVEAGRGGEAAAAARQLLARAEAHMQAPASVLLGRAQQVAGDCRAAIASFDEAKRLGTGLAPYLDLQSAECSGKLGDRAGQAARAASALAAATSRLAQVDALEHRVDAALKQGDRETALQESEQLLTLATTRGYRAQTWTSIGHIQVGLGRRDAATRAYATVVAELPETAQAPEALQTLADLNALDAVDNDQAGLVHHFHGRHDRAVAAFATALLEGLPRERAARALYHQGRSLLRLERTDEAVDALQQVAGLVPESGFAPQALLAAGRALEAIGYLSEAEALYRQAADGYPSAWYGQEAHQRLVISLLLRGALPEAVQTARELASGGADSRWKGLALLWAGKALARSGDPAGATRAWQQAADLDPNDFGGLRARAILDGEPRPTSRPRALDLTALLPTAADRAELEGWLRANGVHPAALDAEQANDSHYVQARELVRVGLREQARWELEQVGSRVANDPARLYALAQAAHDWGEPRLGIRYAVEARRASGQPLHLLPRLVQRAIMPLPYADLIVA
ncbi:MAG: tetratricopeptide repeat protein, partial [Chloroflexi bacterium]|nr:tetratricopeptide repeat protein [Chloroflexota bacterium]